MSARAKENWVDPDAEDADLLAGGGGGCSEGQPRFTRQQQAEAKCRDWWILPVWALAMALVVGFGFTAFAAHREEMMDPKAPAGAGAPQRDPIRFNGAAFGLLVVLIGSSVALSLAYLLLIKSRPRELIWASLIAFTVLLGGLAVWSFAQQRIFAGVIFTLCVPLHLWYIYLVRASIPFATELLRTVSRVLDLWPASIGVAVAGLFLQAAWFLLWLVAGVSIFFSLKIEFENGKPVSASDGQPTRKVVTFQMVCVLFALLLALFWTSQVIGNIVHTTVSGVMATWYFLADRHGKLHGADAAGGGAGGVSSPVSSALRRACTTSFGSIVLGSFVNAFVKALRWTFHLISKWLMSEETSCLTVAVVCIVDCLLRWIEAVVEYVNMYALSYVAIYGKSYFESAHLTYQLMKRRGLDAVVNDDIIGTVLLFGCLFSAAVCAALAGLLGAYVLASAGGDWRLWSLVGFLLGFVLTLTVMSVVESSVVTLFVCLADDPAVLRHTKRDVYDALVPSIEAKYEGVDLDTLNQAPSDDHEEAPPRQEEGRRGGQQA